MSGMTDPAGRLASWLEPFSALFTRPTWRRVVVLMRGAILTLHRRTVSSALRTTGHGQASDFARYHNVLNRSRWSALASGRLLLSLLIAAFVPSGPIVVGLDDTIERGWGARIKARGIYRDLARSNRGHFVKASGLRWLSMMLLVSIPWARRVWALPFLTVLVPSKRWAQEHRVRHKSLIDSARQMLLQLARWVPDRQLVAVSDSSSAINLLDAVRFHVAMITRLRLDAQLYRPPTSMVRPSHRAHDADPARALFTNRAVDKRSADVALTRLDRQKSHPNSGTA